LAAAAGAASQTTSVARMSNEKPRSLDVGDVMREKPLRTELKIAEKSRNVSEI